VSSCAPQNHRTDAAAASASADAPAGNVPADADEIHSVRGPRADDGMSAADAATEAMAADVATATMAAAVAVAAAANARRMEGMRQALGLGWVAAHRVLLFAGLPVRANAPSTLTPHTPHSC
jgi:hypothetical protein